jgi:hypothetical protein
MMIGAMGDFFSFAVCEGELQGGLRVIDSVCARIGCSKNQRRDTAWRMPGEKSGDIHHSPNKKSHSIEWLNHMIVKLKFGGPCWT